MPSIIDCFGEDIDFPNGTSTPNISTNTGYARITAGYSRCSIYASNNLFLESTPFAEQTSLWVGVRIRFLGGQSGWFPVNEKFFGLGKAGLGVMKGLYLTTGSESVSTLPRKMDLVKFDGTTATVLATTAAAVIASSAVQKYDIQVVSYGASATVKVYVDNVLVISYSGDISIATVGGYSCVQAACVQYVAYNDCYAPAYISECIVADFDTRPLSMVTHYPTAAGDANDWTGAYTDIDEVTLSDTDLIYTDTADENAQFNMSNLPAGVILFPVALVYVARAMAAVDASIGTLKLGANTGGAVDVDAGHTLTNSWAIYKRVATTLNGAALTTALVDAMQYNLQSAT
jgi:hypothetical protein